jgi:internalin A
VEIVRDKTTLVHGDLISHFMLKIGEGDRVFIFLSDKYLHSPFCMFELFEMWRNSRQNKAEFLRKVRFFTLDGTKIGTPREWLAYTKFWKQERDELRKAINSVGWQDAGEEAIKRYRHMKDFTDKVSDVLALFADVVQARSFEDFVRDGFGDVPRAEVTAETANEPVDDRRPAGGGRSAIEEPAAQEAIETDKRSRTTGYTGPATRDPLRAQRVSRPNQCRRRAVCRRCDKRSQGGRDNFRGLAGQRDHRPDELICAVSGLSLRAASCSTVFRKRKRMGIVAICRAEETGPEAYASRSLDRALR